MLTAKSTKNATIIGAEGFIGTALHSRLQSLGWSCVLPGRQTDWKLASPLGHIFYCAGLTADYALRPADTVEAHVGQLSRILSADNWESLVYLSSTRLYDGQPRARSGVEDGMFQVNPKNARHLYDLTKLLGENLCHVMGKGKARVARLACVYRDENDPDGFIGDLLRRVLKTPPGSALLLDSSPHFRRDYVHLDDAVEALLQIAVGGQHSVYNVAHGSSTSNADLANVLAHCTGVRITFGRTDQPVTGTAAKCARLKNEFNWTPRSIEQAMTAWAEKHGRTGMD